MLLGHMPGLTYKFVLHMPPQLPSDLASRVIVAPHAGRDLRVFKQFIFAIACLRRERPKVLVSTGAGIGVIFGLAAKLLGIPFLFVESPTRQKALSLSGRMAYLFADRIYVRTKVLVGLYPRAITFEK